MQIEKTPTVSVIIPVYNSASTIKRAIDSVLAQTLSNIEIIIIDDGSTDSSLAIAKDLASTNLQIKIIHLECNGGKARAMNYVIAIARGNWIAILDADDRYAPRRLEILTQAGEKYKLNMVADNQLHIDNANGQVVRQAFNAPGSGREIGLSDLISHSDIGGTFDFGILKPMVRSDFLRRSDLRYHPDARFSEDFYFLLEFFCIGEHAWLVHEPLYEWTLPFSPTARRWTDTGSGAWRYDYRNALQTNSYIKRKLGNNAPPELINLLDRREREYHIMVHYLDAQKAFASTGNPIKALIIIAGHPSTWPLLMRRVAGRVKRFVIR